MTGAAWETMGWWEARLGRETGWWGVSTPQLCHRVGGDLRGARGPPTSAAAALTRRGREGLGSGLGWGRVTITS